MRASAKGAVTPVPALAMLAEESKHAQQHSSHIRYPFWFGGSASSMAACITHPLDLRDLRVGETDVKGRWREMGFQGLASQLLEDWTAYSLYIHVLGAPSE
ncbi:Mitochondrial dicarboxylate transporter, partial [Exophiala xenobiotica]